MQQLLALALHHARHRNTGRARYHLGNFLRTDLRAQQLEPRPLNLSTGFRPAQLCFELRQPPVLQLGNFLPVTLALGCLHIQLDPVDLFLDVLRTLDFCLFRFPHFIEISIFTL